ncbi:hypothetical protein DPMN_117047 [Dreissena polymorpha]|uniref:Uncharacterized protein n=1 Tax=Dreissena polymorpha TaxID=45954 RepID=A0A9D4QUU1_DREPO|nr:hypothetical protein DPMN_117047 [Dreissena polymorpha]
METAKAEGGQDITEEDRKLLEAYKKLDVKTEIENTEDLVKFMSTYRCRKKAEDRSRSVETSRYVEDRKYFDNRRYFEDRRYGEDRPMNSRSYPRISTFGGVSGKGEASWESFKFEVQSLMADRIFREEHILFGIRKAAKEDVTDIVRRLGTNVTVNVKL